jgi:hypothetical protein
MVIFHFTRETGSSGSLCRMLRANQRAGWTLNQSWRK